MGGPQQPAAFRAWCGHGGALMCAGSVTPHLPLASLPALLRALLTAPPPPTPPHRSRSARWRRCRRASTVTHATRWWGWCACRAWRTRRRWPPSRRPRASCASEGWVGWVGGGPTTGRAGLGPLVRLRWAGLGPWQRAVHAMLFAILCSRPAHCPADFRRAGRPGACLVWLGSARLSRLLPPAAVLPQGVQVHLQPGGIGGRKHRVCAGHAQRARQVRWTRWAIVKWGLQRCARLACMLAWRTRPGLAQPVVTHSSPVHQSNRVMLQCTLICTQI